MKGILVLLVLLKVHTSEVCSQPYPANSDGTCIDSKTEYQLDGSNLCCKKCQPGHRLKQECSENTETLCEKCPTGQFLEGTNYSPNCLSCDRCKSAKGLQYLQNCSSTTRSKCGCLPGMYCIMHFDDSYCSACSKYKLCKAGYGVSMPGTAVSDVKCERCPNGTFSDTVSYTDRCQPHTNCRGGLVVRKGNATTDTVCQPKVLISNISSQTSAKEPHTEVATATMIIVSDSKAPHGLTDSTLSVSLSVSAAVFNHSTKSPASNETSDSTLVVVCATGVLLLIAIILLLCWKIIWKKGAAKLDLKVDANGNCTTADRINQDYLGEAQVISLTVTSPEQQCLLEKGEACSDQSQISCNTETLTRTDNCSSCESISPQQSTVALHSPHSAFSEPMTLLSNAEPAPTQTSIPTQPSSQPTSPQIISPVTTSPHVNVNITFHIGHGSVGTPSVMPTDLRQADYQIPFGEEEESFSIPQQEAGKQSVMAVQESASYSA